ncbi:MAG: BMP family ABC transporter substrate-binding protein [Coriobacteriales bacterium]|jgi:basic membrane protein A|nr:BMP family ABC transporter substrate-binding protein [Coriobacteriales bacterium]
MKKIVVLLAALVCALALFGCSSGGGDKPPANDTPPAADNTPATTETDTTPATEGEGLKIAIVTSPSGVDDGSFNQDNYNGVQAFISANPSATVVPIREQDTANAVPAVEAIVADYDVIVTPGFQFAAIYDLATANPDKKFILVDAFPADAEGNEVSAENIYAMQFAEQESGFFAGIAAAMQTTSGKVASVHGIAYPSNVNYQFGFASGVNYANKNLGTSAEVVELPSYAGTDVTDAPIGGNYVGDFSDEAGGKVVGESLLAEGVDIIFVAAGASGNGVFTAVKEKGDAFVIGCDVDQYDDGANGSANIVLTSGLKVMAPNVAKQLEAVADGSFTGANETLTASTDSTGYVKDTGRHQLTDETLAALDEAYAKVKAGDIVPASNFNDSTPADFKGL